MPIQVLVRIKYFDTDCCRYFYPAMSSLPAAPAWVEANRLGWQLVGVIHSAIQGKKPDNRPRLEGAHYRNTRQAAHSYLTRLPHTSLTHIAHIYQFPSSPWDSALDRYIVSALKYTVGWACARNNKQTPFNSNSPIKSLLKSSSDFWSLKN